MAKAMAAYQCQGCDEFFRTLEEAQKCCYPVTARDVFKCTRCRKRHPYMDIAQTCCAIKGKAGHQCSFCGALYLKEENARECCYPAKLVAVYECDTCGELWASEESAANCCEKKEN